MSEVAKSFDVINKEIASIAKDQKAGSGSFGFKFRGIDQVLVALSPLFKQESIVTKKELINSKHESRLIKTKNGERTENWAFYHCRYTFLSLKDGSELVTDGFGEGLDSSDKATGKAISNAYKYVIFELLNIPTADQQDSDMALKPINTASPKEEYLKKLNLEKEAGPDTMYTPGNIDSDIPDSDENPFSEGTDADECLIQVFQAFAIKDELKDLQLGFRWNGTDKSWDAILDSTKAKMIKSKFNGKEGATVKLQGV